MGEGALTQHSPRAEVLSAWHRFTLLILATALPFHRAGNRRGEAESPSQGPKAGKWVGSARKVLLTPRCSACSCSTSHFSTPRLKGGGKQ